VYWLGEGFEDRRPSRLEYRVNSWGEMGLQMRGFDVLEQLDDMWPNRHMGGAGGATSTVSVVYGTKTNDDVIHVVSAPLGSSETVRRVKWLGSWEATELAGRPVFLARGNMQDGPTERDVSGHQVYLPAQIPVELILVELDGASVLVEGARVDHATMVRAAASLRRVGS
jgi:hypothetical protein